MSLTFMQAIAENLRLELNLSVTEITRKLGVNRQTWYDWLKGNYNPKSAQIKHLADMCHVPPSGLIAHTNISPHTSSPLSNPNSRSLLSPATASPAIDTLAFTWQPADTTLFQQHMLALANARHMHNRFWLTSLLSRSHAFNKGYRWELSIEKHTLSFAPHNNKRPFARVELTGLSRPQAVNPGWFLSRFVLPFSPDSLANFFRSAPISRIDIACDYSNPASNFALDNPRCRVSDLHIHNYYSHGQVTTVRSLIKGNPKRNCLVCYCDPNKAARVEARSRPRNLVLGALGRFPSPFAPWRLYDLDPSHWPGLREALGRFPDPRALFGSYPALEPWLRVEADPYHPHAWVSRRWPAVVRRLARQLAVPPAWLGLAPPQSPKNRLT